MLDKKLVLNMKNLNVSGKWKTVSTKEVYKNAWIRVNEDKIIHPNGKEGLYGVVEVPVGVYAIAINERKELLLIKQTPYPTGLETWSLPAGALKPGSTLLDQVAEELSEETGYSAKEWTEIGITQAQPGITTQIDHFFIAKQLSHDKLLDDKKLQLEEGISEIGFFSFEQVNLMVQNGLITHGQTLSGLYLYEAWKNK